MLQRKEGEANSKPDKVSDQHITEETDATAVTDSPTVKSATAARSEPAAVPPAAVGTAR